MTNKVEKLLLIHKILKRKAKNISDEINELMKSDKNTSVRLPKLKSSRELLIEADKYIQRRRIHGFDVVKTLTKTVKLAIEYDTDLKGIEDIVSLLVFTESDETLNDIANKIRSIIIEKKDGWPSNIEDITGEVYTLLYNEILDGMTNTSEDEHTYTYLKSPMIRFVDYMYYVESVRRIIPNLSGENIYKIWGTLGVDLFKVERALDR